MKHEKKNELDQILIGTVEKDSFFSYFFSLDQVKTKTNAEIIRNSDIEKSYYYQIMKGNRVPSRNKVLRLCIGAGLSTEETSHALILNENAPLYLKRKRDKILSYAIENGLTVTETNILLDEHGEITL